VAWILDFRFYILNLRFWIADNHSVDSQTEAGKMPAKQPAGRRRYKPLAAAILFYKAALVLPEK
jgi:hypothetical protein